MYETWLIPYLEGTLDAERRALLEARLADDPALTSALTALRRADPRLRAVAGRLRQSEAARPAPASLWPGLRGRLAARPARPALFGPAFWWAGGGLGAAVLLVVAVLFGPVLRPEAPDRKTAKRYRAPVIVSHRDNGGGTALASRLDARARRVAAERRAAGAPTRTLVAARPAPTLPPTSAMAAPPPAPPAPGAVSVPYAPPLPPLRVAKREPGPVLPYPVGLPPPPTHSPPPPAARDFSAARPVMPAPTHSPPPRIAQKQVAGVSDAPVTQDGRAENGLLTPPAAAPAPAAPSADGQPLADTFGGGRAGVPQSRVAPGLNTAGSDTLRQGLERALTPPAYGTGAAETQERKALAAARQRGSLGALRAALLAEDADGEGTATARLRATLAEDGGDRAGAAAQWRLLVRRPDAVAEDWFRLAQAEARLGRADAARRAYAQALRPGLAPLSAAHRSVAAQNAVSLPAPPP